MDEEFIRAIKFCLKYGLQLSDRQRAYYLLFIASEQEAKEFLEKEKEKKE